MPMNISEPLFVIQKLSFHRKNRINLEHMFFAILFSTTIFSVESIEVTLKPLVAMRERYLLQS